MNRNRRHFIVAASSLLATRALRASPGRRRVIIVGAGWGGLAAARQLRELAPEIEVLLIEKNERFVSLPITNRWLAGLDDGRSLYQPLAAIAERNGYQLLRQMVTGIDRANQRLITADGPLPYDWLLLSPGVREDWDGLAGGDAAAAQRLKQATFSGFVPEADFARLKLRLTAFAGGNFLLNVPPAPYRCPPAPYERAVMLAWLFKSRGLKAKITLVDPNAPWPGYQRVFREYFRDQITYLPQTRLHQVDLERRVASLDVDEVTFDEAILMPTQQAGDLCWQAGLIHRNEAGQATGWADVDPLTFRSRADPHIFVVGDSIGRVSPLFGYYPKTGQLAAHMGRIAAAQIVAASRGVPVAPELPGSTCYAQLSVEPPETVEIVSAYARRGDGQLVQTIRQSRNNQPAGEADHWLDAMHRELFGLP